VLLDAVGDNQRRVSKAEKQASSTGSDFPPRKWESVRARATRVRLQGAEKDAHVDAALGDQDPRCVDPDAGDGEEQFA
jgi:hypothetical protein